jgi:hypothetical protein
MKVRITGTSLGCAGRIRKSAGGTIAILGLLQAGRHLR